MLPRFCHNVLPTDDAALALLQRLGLLEAVRWERVETCFHFNGGLYGITSPLSLLTFKPLPFGSRIRLGILSLEALLGLTGDDIEGRSASEWLLSKVGKEATTGFFEPLSWVKYKQGLHGLSASWVWNRLQNSVRMGSKTGVLGNRLELLVQTLRSCIEKNSGRVETSCEVTNLRAKPEGYRAEVQGTDGKDEIDVHAVVACIPRGELLSMPPCGSGELHGIQYQSIINLCFILEERMIDRNLSIVFAYDDIPLGGLIHHLFDRYGGPSGMAICYAYRYLGVADPSWQASDEAVIEEAKTSLDKIFPGFGSKIREVRVFRERFASPIFTRDFQTLVSEENFLPRGVFTAGAHLMYPEMPTIGSAAESGFLAASRVMNYLRSS